MSEIRCVRNSDLPLIVASSGDWLGLTGLIPEARLQLFDLGLFSKPSFDFQSTWVSLHDGQIEALVVTTKSQTTSHIDYANASPESVGTVDAILRHILTENFHLGTIAIGMQNTTSGVLAHVPGIIERSGLRASFFPLRDTLLSHGFTQGSDAPLLRFNPENQRPAFSRDQMELRRTHAIATAHDIVLPDWSDNLELSHLNTLELQLQDRETAQADATVVLTAIPDGHPSQSTVTMRSCHGDEPYLSALVSDLCRGHQGTLFANLPDSGDVLQKVGFEVSESFTTWQQN